MSHITNSFRCQLAASRFIYDPKPEQLLRWIFDKIVTRFENNTLTNCNERLRNHVWSKVSQRHLGAMQAVWIKEYCDRVLRPLTDSQIQSSYQINLDSIEAREMPNINFAICQYARENLLEWGHEIFAELQRTASAETFL